MFNIIKKTKSIFLYSFIFIVSFIFFLYLLFPYNILKEFLLSKINAGGNLKIQVEELVPNFPLGLELRKIKISYPELQKSVVFNRLGVKLSIFSLLRLHLLVEVDLRTQAKGHIVVETDFSVLSLFKQKFFPQKVGLHIENFSVQNPVELLLASYSHYSKGVNPMIKSLLKVISLDGRMNSQIQLTYDENVFVNSHSNVDISLVGAKLSVHDSALNINPQLFKKSKISGKLQNGIFTFSPRTGFESEELVVSIKGNTKLSNNIKRSKLDLNVAVKLKKELKENSAMILKTVNLGSTDGQINMRIHGPLVSPQIDTF